jgi:hypothetical protein
MSHNVPGCMRCFCGCDKGTRSVPATAKMWVEGAVGGVADLGNWNPGAAFRRRSAYNPVRRSMLCFLFFCYSFFITCFQSSCYPFIHLIRFWQ